MVVYDFNPKTEIPSLAGQVILITGGTAGLGRATVFSLAAQGPAEIIFTGRSQSSADALSREMHATYPNVTATFLQCDLSSLATVHKAGRQLAASLQRLDKAIFNAGIMALPASVSEDGYEIQFATNHIGQALLAKLLIPTMEKTAAQGIDVRTVWLSSQGFQLHPSGGIIFDKLKTPQANIFPIWGGWLRYGQSKLANLLYARALSVHHPTITSVAVHPGISITNLVTNMAWSDRLIIALTTIGRRAPPEQVSYNQQWAATAPLGSGKKQVQSGKYYEPVGIHVVPGREGTNDRLMDQLWTWTQIELEAYKL